MRRATFVTIGDRDAASSRVRAYEVADELSARGWHCRVVPLDGGRRRRVVALARALAARDVLVLQKVTPAAAVARLLRLGCRHLVWDCDDALLLGYPSEAEDVTRARRPRIHALLRRVDVVTTTNETLAREMAPATGRTFTMPGPAPAPWSIDSAKERVVVWTGSPSTEPNLRLMGREVAELVRAGWTCVALGAGALARDLGWEAHPWSPTEARAWLGRASVGVMPLVRDPWNDRKAGYKVLEYLAAGVVPVVSSSPAARTVFGSADVGVIVAPNGTWIDAVELAVRDREHYLVEGSRRLFELSIARWTDSWIAAVSG